jgi:hypothetical protein
MTILRKFWGNKIPGFLKFRALGACFFPAPGCGTAFDKDRYKIECMETKTWGMIVSSLGVIGLVAAVLFMNTADGMKHLVMLSVGGVLGAVAFFAGIRMIPRT